MMEEKAQWVLEEPTVSPVPQVVKVLWVHRALLVSPVLPDLKETKEVLGLSAHLEVLAQEDPLEHQELQESLVDLELLVLMEFRGKEETEEMVELVVHLEP